MRRIILITLILGQIMQKSLAQTPQNYPTPGPEPVEINFFNVLLYFVVPVLIIIAYFLARKTLKKRSGKNG